MNRNCKFNVKGGLAIVLTSFFAILTVFIQPVFAGEPGFNNYLQSLDTIKPQKKVDTAFKKQRSDSLIQKVDTLTISKDSIEAPIKYIAEDSGVLVIDTKEFFLYGKAKVNYTDLKLDAATISSDQRTQIVKAFGSLDSTGNPLSKPQFIQGEMKSVSDTILYNMKSGKGLTRNTFFQEGEIYVNAIDLKKISATEVFA